MDELHAIFSLCLAHRGPRRGQLTDCLAGARGAEAQKTAADERAGRAIGCKPLVISQGGSAGGGSAGGRLDKLQNGGRACSRELDGPSHNERAAPSSAAPDAPGQCNAAAAAAGGAPPEPWLAG